MTEQSVHVATTPIKDLSLKYKGANMTIIKERGHLRIYAGADMAHGLFIGENTKTGKMSLWDNTPNIQLKDCIY